MGLYEDRQSGMNLVKVAGGQIPAQLVPTGTTISLRKWSSLPNFSPYAY